GVALTVGDFLVNIGLDDAGFTKGVADMLAEFEHSTEQLVSDAKAAGQGMIDGLTVATDAMGSISKAAADLLARNYTVSFRQVKGAIKDAVQNIKETGSLGPSLESISSSATATAGALQSTLVPALSQLGLDSAASIVETGASFVTMAAEAIPALIEMGLQIGA